MQPSVRRYPDLKGASRALAETIVALARKETAAKGFFSLVLSGGTTPRLLYGSLAGPPFNRQMPWQQTYIFWGDERCVPLTHPESNFAAAQEILLARVDIPAANIHPVRTGRGNPMAAAEEYEALVRDFFRACGGTASVPYPRFDCILLGMGRDGHTASLFPGSELLHETEKWVAAVPEPSAAPPVPRITMTLPVINRAAQVLFLISGMKKNKILQEILGDPEKAGQRYPAARVKPAQRLVWFVAP